jgi:hypothetical protein
MMTTMRAMIGAGLVLACFGVAMAKLPPAPPLTDAQKVAAEEKKAKDALTAEAAKAQQARAEDRVVARYQAMLKAEGKPIPTPQLPPSSAAQSAPAKGLSAQPEKAAAHSPPKK